MSRATELQSILSAACDAYYGDQESSLTDAEYDVLVDELRALDPNAPILAQIGAPVLGGSGRARVTHKIPMTSLAKVTSYLDFVEWAGNVSGPYIIMDKMDGASIDLRYRGGKFVQAVTRGDGTVGEDVTDNAMRMKFPKTVNGFTGEIRAEVMITLPDFMAHFAGEKNPRNSANGTMKRSDGRNTAHLTAFAYDVFQEGATRPNKDVELAMLQAVGFQTPKWYRADGPDDVARIYNEYLAKTRASLDYEIDGLVISVNDAEDRDAYGESSGRPKGSIAFKFPSMTGTTVLNSVTWQVGKSGRVTPVAEFRQILLAGATCTRASLHNIAFIERLGGLNEGDTITCARMNDVIPGVVNVVQKNSSGLKIVPPTTCPCCASELFRVGEYLMCQNDDCSAQVSGGMRRWVSKIGVLHFGENLIDAITEAGLAADIAELYSLDPNTVANLTPDGRRVGLTVATKAIQNLHAAKNMDLATFVGSLGIPLIGRSMMRFFVDEGYDTLGKLWAASEATLANLPNVGPVKASALYNGLRSRENLILRIIAEGVTITPPVTVAVTGSKMNGISVCMTGFRDADMEAKIVAEGGSVASGVSKNLGILVTKDPGSNSGKTQKARQLGIQIMDINEMWAALGGR